MLYLNAVSAYCANQYGISIDPNMIQNVLLTDLQEVTDLLNLHLFGYILLLGVIPHIIIANTTIIYQSFWKETLRRILLSFLLILVATEMILLNYNEISLFLRSHKYNMGYLAPGNYIYSTIKLGTSYLNHDFKIYKIAEDATIKNSKDKIVVVLIVGESARKHNFSLFGYNRETNPYLKTYKDLILLNNATSCGTSTAVAVPCMFSHLDQNHFMRNKKNYEFLPHLLVSHNIDVAWIPNNQCYQVCHNINSFIDISSATAKHCTHNKCLDDILLDSFVKYLTTPPTQNTFIVLHQNGSHGPLYHERYPKEFEKFKPVCTTSDLHKCSKEELINAYDNTILYTDYFIHSVISKLQTMSVPSVVIYTSDHGESLGENNIYLHGLPYEIAPKEQKEIPLIVWLSPSLIKSKNFKLPCIDQNSSYSHDNIFHSILNIFGISTSIYDKNLDIFANCKK